MVAWWWLYVAASLACLLGYVLGAGLARARAETRAVPQPTEEPRGALVDELMAASRQKTWRTHEPGK